MSPLRSTPSLSSRLALAFVAAILLSWSPPASARELPFGPSSNFTTTLDGPMGLAVADMSGDGLADVVACGENAGEVKYWINLGGVFASATVETGLDSPYTVAVGDLDGDGDGDVVVGQYDNIPMPPEPPFPPEASELIWYANPKVGGGGWVAHPLGYFTSWGMRKVVTSDLDGDGDLDIAVTAVGTTSEVFWVENDGPLGSWPSHPVTSNPATPFGLAAVDVDADGDQDLIVTDLTDDDVLWYENDGVPNDYWTEHLIDGNLNGAVSLASGDIDLDGTVDIVAAGASSDTVVWYERSGAAWTKHTAGTGLNGVRAVVVSDLDLDGDLDLAAANELEHQVVWIENVDGSGGAWIEREVMGSTTSAVDVAAADLDGDGDPEVLGAINAIDRVSFWKNELVHRRFEAADPKNVATGLGDPRALATGDLNGDGLLDVVTAQWDTDEITAYLAFDSTGFLWWTNAVATGFDGARDVAVADMNGDGHLDVLATAVVDDTVRWWSNNGEALPTWTAHTVSSACNGAHRVEPFDYDRDGDMDLVTAAYDGDRVDLWENTNGLGTAWTQHLLGALNGPFDLVVADFNADGKPDVAATGYDADAVHVYLNSVAAGGLWADVTALDWPDGPRGIDAADIDGDGDVDFVFVERLANQIFWYANNGTGTAWGGHTVGTGSFTDGAQVRAEDLDGDGDADIVAASQSEGDVFVWKNGGDGTSWSRYQMEQSLGAAWDVVAGDVDRDGRPDLIVAAGGATDSVLWYPDIGGQCSSFAQSWAPSSIANGADDIVFYFILGHEGRAGYDASMEMSMVLLDFADTAGHALTSSQANAIIDRLDIYQDTDRDSTLTAADALVMTDLTLALAGGRLNLAITDGKPEAEVEPGVTWGYFLVLKATANASLQVPNQIRVTLPGDGLLGQDRDHDLSLLGEPRLDVTTKSIAFGAWGGALLSDGFERGTSSAWSYQRP